MDYVKFHADWHNENEALDTPITAEALEHLEEGIASIFDLATTAGGLIVASAPGELEELDPGTPTDDDVLTWDSGEPLSMKWAPAVANVPNVAWGTSYTPVLTGAGGNPTMGAGSTAVGRYTKVGRTIHFRANISFGTSPANPTGLWIVSLPENAQTTNAFICHGVVYDASPGATYVVACRTNAAGNVHLFYQGGDRFSGTTPITVAVNDIVAIGGSYEAAA